MGSTDLSRSVALVLLGAWLMGTVFMGVVATQNFYTIDRLLEGSPNQTFRGVVSDLGNPRSRDFLRYLSSELNRLLFWVWGLSQVLIGGVTLWLLWPSGGRVRWGIVTMLTAVVVLTFGLTPPIVDVGRQLDFLPRDPPPPELATFGLLHAAYTVTDFLKLAVGVACVFWVHRIRPDDSLGFGRVGQ